MKLSFLGTGTSHGIPVLGCGCRVCASADPRDTRYRSSALVEGSLGERVLIDAGPEFRLQALRAGLTSLDAVLITHAHADHVHGLDDLRPLCRKNPLAVWASNEDEIELRERFSYVFRRGQEGGGKPRLKLCELGAEGVRIGSLEAIPIPLEHGERRVYGYRIGPLAYLTDCSGIPEASMGLLSGTRVLVLDALRERAHPTHFSLREAFAAARELKPERLYLTHICHDLTHREIQGLCAAEGLPFMAEPAYDGLSIDFK
jgi:phosphoribosyl 1,2-cyclic phosphate phosphodiesterase